MDAGGPKGKAKSDINVTPLIDIVLVLLIIFIVMVPSLAKALPVVVPQVVKTDKPQEPDKKNPPLVLEIIPKGENDYQYLFQSQAIEYGQITETLAPLVQLQPMTMRKVYVKVDEDITYGVVVSVLDRVRAASEIAKAETKKKPELLGQDGGDVKVATSIRKRT